LGEGSPSSKETAVATIGKANPHARRLRREATDAERRLWHHLRNRQLGGFKFKRQETIGYCIADFACVECKIVVEADGGQHSPEVDRERTTDLSGLGWKVFRFWNNDILQNTDGVLAVILAACDERRKGKPSPCSLPHAGEGK
jgi:very-short-patch-repair endonuclease